MGSTSGSIQFSNQPRSGWLVHLPLWVVIVLGGLVMFASETPEAARRPLGRVVVGEISLAAVPAATSGQFQMPGTLTDLGMVPPSSRIAGYQDHLALTKFVAEPGLPSWHGIAPSEPVRATPGLAALRHSHERRRLAMQSSAGALDLVGQDNAHKVVSREAVNAAELIDTLIARIDLHGETFADEMTGSSGLIDLRHRQHKIADFLARYYRRSKDKIRRYIRFAYESAQQHGVDPLLVVGIMCVESSLNPRATSNKGAKGLMQVLVHAHKKKFKPFGGTKNAYDPRTSIEVGTRIIAGMIARTGSVKKGLKHYVGAANFRSDSGYGNKVIGMRDRVWAASVGKRIPARPNIKLAIRRAESAQTKFKAVVVTASR